ncbi:MAG: hypothetical protein HZA00_10845 [Nitrospinae bacterium]|nr:hypothetical protein [Nitrospinota bacterium]
MSQKILVVEDNDKNRLLMRDILRYHGYEVLRLLMGKRGLRWQRSISPP